MESEENTVSSIKPTLMFFAKLITSISLALITFAIFSYVVHLIVSNPRVFWALLDVVFVAVLGVFFYLILFREP